MVQIKAVASLLIAAAAVAPALAQGYYYEDSSLVSYVVDFSKRSS